MKLQALRGTTDLLPDDLKRWSSVEHAVRRLCRLYGYREIRTPIIEDAALFLRSIGETSDIVQKEMFRFEDRGGHDIVLRPEGTASIVRAYLEHSLDKTDGFTKLFYLGPMFRAERPQAGRFRQFHQFGVEAIGSVSPWVDVESITLCMAILRACGVTDAAVWLASMGCRKDQERSAQELRKRLSPQRTKLCKECQARLEKNVFRILDCKNPTCHALAWETTEAQEARGRFQSPFLLCEECKTHFDEVRRGLKVAGIVYDDTKVFARGLDYYTRTVFEVRAAGLGAKDAVAAGGRYDHLVEELGGPSVGAFGFAAGIERVLMAMSRQQAAAQEPPKRHGIYVAVVQPGLLADGFKLVQQLRERGVAAATDYDGKSLKAQLREADKAGCRIVGILGEQELKQGTMTLKDLEQGDQETVPLDQVATVAAQRLNTACHA